MDLEDLESREKKIWEVIFIIFDKILSYKSSEEFLDSLNDNPFQKSDTKIASTDTDFDFDFDFDKSESTLLKRQSPISNLILPLSSTPSSHLQIRLLTFL